MKLVKEYINEKFTEDSDPVQDLSIGVKSAIEYSFKKFFELNKEYGEKIYYSSHYYTYLPLKSCTRTYPAPFSFSDIKDILCINIYSDTYYSKNKKVINKKRLINKLIKESGLNIFFKIIPSNNTDDAISEVYYKIKPEYREFFSKEKIQKIIKISINELS